VTLAFSKNKAFSRSGAPLMFPNAIVKALRKKTSGLRVLGLEQETVSIQAARGRDMQSYFLSTLTRSVRMNEISICVGCNARSSK
jgi:hypothetical protein